MLTRLKTYLIDLYQREPARTNAAIVAGVIAAGAALGVALSAPVVLAVVTLAAPFIVAELTRAKVTPDVQVVEKEQAAFEAGVELASRPANAEGPLPPDSLGP